MRGDVGNGLRPFLLYYVGNSGGTVKDRSLHFSLCIG